MVQKTVRSARSMAVCMLAVASLLLGFTGSASANAAPTVAVTGCDVLDGGGYLMTLSGSGFAPEHELIVQWNYPNWIVTRTVADNHGSFSNYAILIGPADDHRPG
jgi:hypothetical protein